MAHQIMIFHDLGYAIGPIKELTEKGKLGKDKGHNLLAAKFVRERIEVPDDLFKHLFSENQISIIHEGVLTHDFSQINFYFGDEKEEARKENLFSAIRIADNTHAFEDKLPELLYTVPETLETMRLMKTVSEIGDESLIEEQKSRLIDKINKRKDLLEREKKSLIRVVRGLNKDSYQFTVGRICGNEPEFKINERGFLEISVEESAIHQEVVGLFHQESYDQLKKFVADLTGKKRRS